MRQKRLISSLIALSAASMAGAVHAAPTLRTQVDQRGDFVMFGNTTGFNASLGVGPTLLLSVGLMAIQALYHIAFVALKGQTPGAMVVKVRVVRLSDGQIPGWGPATMRYLPNAVGLIPCCVGSLLALGLWIWALVNLFSNERRQTPFQLLEVYETPELGRIFRLDGFNMTSERDEFFYHENLVHPAAAAHPGVSHTNLVTSSDGLGAIPGVKYVAPLFLKVFLQSAAKGAWGSLYAATEAEPGSYTGPQRVREQRGPVGPARRQRRARDLQLAKDLWALSEEKTGVVYDW